MSRILLSLLSISVALCGVASGKLMATISMNKVEADIEFQQESPSTVVATIKRNVGVPLGGVSVEIRSRWMNYDVEDKCSDKMLGASLTRLTGSWAPESVDTFKLIANLADLQGRSIRIESKGVKYCASIWSDTGFYLTAAADFKGQIGGTVYFRQPMDGSGKTLVACDLVSDQVFSNLKWKITDGIKSCDDENSVANAAAILPGGDLSGNLGPPQVQMSNQVIALTNYASSNLLLTHDSNSIIDKFLIIFESDYTKSSCAKIRRVQPQRATTLFSHEGIEGRISFMQSSPFDPTKTSVELRGLNSGAKGYHIHVYPVPIQTEKNQDLCSDAVVAGHYNPFGIKSFPNKGTSDEFEIGDLSSKYGNLKGLKELKKMYTDWNLPLFGRHSIVGRSVVIHRDDQSNSRWVCSNIHLDHWLVAAVAVFKYPVYGHIYFIQAKDMTYTDTWVYAHLGYLDDTTTPSSSGYRWHINANKAKDELASGSGRCATNKDVFDPYGGASCTPKDTMVKCKVGDMSGKHGKILVDTYPRSQTYVTDQRLPLAGKNSIVGKSVVILDETGTNVLACATIVPLHKPVMKAEISIGTITFTQQPGFGSRPTIVSWSVSTFDMRKQKLQINSLPPIGDNSKCTDLGGVYNPLQVSENAQSVTRDQFMMGSFPKGTIGWTDLNLPLTGLTSIRHRTLTLIDIPTNSITSCGIIQDPFSGNFDGYQVVAKATFGPPLEGYIHLFQTLFKDGTMTDTSAVVNLSNEDGSKTLDHNWHVHVNLVAGDATASSGRCSSAGPHYDPYMAKIGNASKNYGKQCSKINPLRCELGDQAMKLGTYSLGHGKRVYTDIDLPLDGAHKVQGRSIVVHVQNKGAPRYACTDIQPVSSLFLLVEFITPTNSDLHEAARLYAGAIKANEHELLVQVESTTDGIAKAKVYFLGFSREINRSRFKVYFGKEVNRDKFGKYSPLSEPRDVNDASNAGRFVVSSVLFLMTLVFNTAIFQF